MKARGDKWVIIGSGPSMLSLDMRPVRKAMPSWKVMAVNCSHRLAPWADVLYAGDLEWWDEYVGETRDFPGERWTRNERAAVRYGLSAVKHVDVRGLCLEPGHVAAGGNSGYQAVNLAYHFGATRIVLVGFDMHRNQGAHWHGDHRRGMLNAPARHIAVWRRNFDALAFDLRARGVRVVNATPGSALTCFPMGDLANALAC